MITVIYYSYSITKPAHICFIIVACYVLIIAMVLIIVVCLLSIFHYITHMIFVHFFFFIMIFAEFDCKYVAFSIDFLFFYDIIIVNRSKFLHIICASFCNYSNF